MPAEPTRSPWALRLHVVFDAVHMDAVLRVCSDMLAAAPEALCAEATMSSLRGRSAIVVDGTYHGHLQDGYALLRRLRTIATPLLDRTAPVQVR